VPLRTASIAGGEINVEVPSLALVAPAFRRAAA
jgi:hypothetical protein